MNAINGITASPVQTLGVVIPDGTRVTLTLSFRPQQNAWFFDCSWPGEPALPVPFSTQNQRLVASANLLRQNRLVLPFGIACFTPDNLDPSTLDAFASGYAALVLLGPADVATVESSVFAPP